MKSTTIFGILNMTEDSFSDGGRYLAADAAIARVAELRDADVLDLGAAASNPDAKAVPPEVEIARLAPVVAALKAGGRAISVDTFSLAVQRWALEQRVDYLNDIQGFAEPALYPALAASQAKLVVMHSVQERGRATRVRVSANEIYDRVCRFFDKRFAALVGAGIVQDRLILDPGMGFFLGSDPDASFEILRRIGDLKARFGVPLLVSVSRKSFLRAVTGRPPQESGAASLGAELYAFAQGADFIRTHDSSALRDAILVGRAIATGQS